MASNDGVLDHFRADQLVVHVALPGHVLGVVLRSGVSESAPTT